MFCVIDRLSTLRFGENIIHFVSEKNVDCYQVARSIFL